MQHYRIFELFIPEASKMSVEDDCELRYLALYLSSDQSQQHVSNRGACCRDSLEGQKGVEAEMRQSIRPTFVGNVERRCFCFTAGPIYLPSRVRARRGHLKSY
jgi:hypothetical protein